MVEVLVVREALERAGFQEAAYRTEAVEVPCQDPFAVPDGQGDPSWEVVDRVALGLEVASLGEGKTAALGARHLARSTTCPPPQSSHRRGTGHNRDTGNNQHGT